jgi:hypothetical protein
VEKFAVLNQNKINIFITVDTEHSIGGAFANSNLKPVGSDRRIFYTVGNTSYGIPLIMDIADHCGLRVSFFTEVLNKYYFGENESRIVCEYIMKRGHDVQLHLHPNYLNFRSQGPVTHSFPDQLYTYPLEKQTGFIAEGKKTLNSFGVNPTAFRAGNFNADRNTLTALAENGFIADTSYSKAYLGKSCRLDHADINDAEYLDGIWEFPVTNFLENSPVGRRYRPLDINGVSFLQMRKVLEQAVEKGPRNITIVMHSFSFINPLDLQYRKMRPRKTVIRRFEKLCRYLAENRSLFRVMTFGELHINKLKDIAENAVHHVPKIHFGCSLARNLEQIWDVLPLQPVISFDKKR